MYKCKNCGEPVLVLPNQEPIRVCKCPKDTVIIAECGGSAHGVGSTKIK